MNNLTTEAEARAESARVSRGGKTRVFTRVTCPSAFSPFMRNAGRRAGSIVPRGEEGSAPRGTLQLSNPLSAVSDVKSGRGGGSDIIHDVERTNEAGYFG